MRREGGYMRFLRRDEGFSGDMYMRSELKNGVRGYDGFRKGNWSRCGGECPRETSEAEKGWVQV